VNIIDSSQGRKPELALSYDAIEVFLNPNKGCIKRMLVKNQARQFLLEGLQDLHDILSQLNLL